MKPKFLITFFCFICCLANVFGQGVWTQKADFGGGQRCAAIGFSIGNKGYIGTGDYTSIYPYTTREFWEWNQADNTWSQKADFGGTMRDYAVGFSSGTKGYIGTGWDTTGYVKDFWEWDQAGNTWTQKANFGGGVRILAVGFSIGTKGYIGLGDYSTAPAARDFWEWDQASDTWTQKANCGSSGDQNVGFSIGTKGYIGTGRISGLGKDFWEWDQAGNTWTQKATFSGIPREGAVGFSIGTKGYIGTGHLSGTSYVQDFWEWDQATNTWMQKVNFGGTARAFAVGFSISDKGYVGTGCDSLRHYKKDFWEFDPAGMGVNELDHQISISVYPNPTREKFTVKIYLGQRTNGELEIYNVFGEKIYQSANLTIPESIIDLSNQPDGIYFIQLSTDKVKAINKIIIQK